MPSSLALSIEVRRYFGSRHFRLATASMQGYRYDMQDVAMAHILSPNSIVSGVFDGHGGASAAVYTASEIPRRLIRLKDVSSTRPYTLLRGPLCRLIMRIDRDFLRMHPHTNAGSTVSMFFAQLIQSCPASQEEAFEILVANLGDSGVIVGDAQSSELVTLPHKPEGAELARIEAMGGFCIDGRVMGTLNMSRAIGDRLLKRRSTDSLTPQQQQRESNPAAHVSDVESVPDEVEEEEECHKPNCALAHTTTPTGVHHFVHRPTVPRPVGEDPPSVAEVLVPGPIGRPGLTAPVGSPEETLHPAAALATTPNIVGDVIISIPDVTAFCCRRGGFVAAMSDGVLDVLGPRRVGDILRKAIVLPAYDTHQISAAESAAGVPLPQNDCGYLCASILREALAAGATDNLSIAVVQLLPAPKNRLPTSELLVHSDEDIVSCSSPQNPYSMSALRFHGPVH